ncbi:hypothetical protein COCVIDRAFT_18804 [Bipolaris victoriae FI3]|uniref:Fungal lipase-type domain-containing protein n=1 Tax=Bipolaris victoriae (strain FI3) TaxID=930091 RepID=W7E089_BIPV3|nr:hypothetical protein COCVIDRAFT_18804 [Bipolaris victoriae FI3]
MKLPVIVLAALTAPVTQAAPTPASELTTRQTRSRELIQPELWPVLQRYTRFAVASLSAFTYNQGKCPSPPFHSVLVRTINSIVTSTQVAVFQDSAAKELIVSFPGSASVQDFITDFAYFLKPFTSAPGCTDCQVHGGLLQAWRSVQPNLTAALAELNVQLPGYKTIIVGHSLGGGLASLAYTDLRANNVPIAKAYTLGSLRVGNPAYADFTDQLAGADENNLGELLRITHGVDGVPNLPFQPMGFQHTRTEIYEEDTQPVGGTQSPQTTFRCFGQEASDCIRGKAVGFINQDHLVYTGISMSGPEQCNSQD